VRRLPATLAALTPTRRGRVDPLPKGEGVDRLGWNARGTGIITLVVALLVACGDGNDDKPPITAAQICAATAEREVLVSSSDLIETSGIAASRSQDDIVWAHNDSGDTARFFALGIEDADGRLMARQHAAFTLSGAEATDWEDMAIGPGPRDGASYLYLSDIGDNAAARPNITVYRVPEPNVGLQPDTPTAEEVEAFDTLTLEYPDQAHDAETLMIDPLSGDLIIVTKELATNVSSVFRASGDLADGSTTTMEQVAEINFAALTLAATPGPDAPVLVAGAPLLPTGGDISPDGSLIAIRTYGAVWVWDRGQGESVADALLRSPCEAPSAVEEQGEAIAFDADGRGYTTISEGSSPPLHHFTVD
jgi:hypothetical protein